MTISMAQGQTLECAGVWLADLCFTHGQLYVAASRVGYPLRIRIALNPEGVTRNVVYHKVLSNVGGRGARRDRDERGRCASGGRRRWLACALVAALVAGSRRVGRREWWARRWARASAGEAAAIWLL